MGQNKLRDGKSTETEGLPETDKLGTHTLRSIRRTRDSNESREQSFVGANGEKDCKVSNAGEKEDEILSSDQEGAEIEKTNRGTAGERGIDLVVLG